MNNKITNKKVKKQKQKTNGILASIGETWKKLPDWRLTQLIDNFYSSVGHDCFYMEDKEFAEELNRWVDMMVSKNPDLI